MGYLIQLQLANKKIVVVGGGEIAARKVSSIIKTENDCSVLAIAPEFCNTFPQDKRIVRKQKFFEVEDIADAHLIFSCIDDPNVNQQIYDHKKDWQWLNDTTDHCKSDFFNTAIVETADFYLAIASKNINPAATKKCKHMLSNYFREK